MGLFTSNKKICPICGEPTPKLFPTKVDGNPLCKGCAHKADLPEGALEQMSVDDFRQYIAVYDENQELRDKFKETSRLQFGLFGGAVLVDTKNKLLRLKDDKYAWVFEASALRSFCVLEDGKPLFEGTRAGFECHRSDVPARLTELAPEITKIVMRRQGHELLENLRDLTDGDDNTQRRQQDYIEIPTPLQQFQMEIQLEHPYWTTFNKYESGPTFDNQHPRIEDYLELYTKRAEEFRNFSKCLMQLLEN